MAEELAKLYAPAMRCSYCGNLHQDEEKNEMGFETDRWAICSKCFRKACDEVSNQ